MRLKARFLKWATILVALGALGFLVAVSGIIPIKASSGHWPITAWFLHFSMRRSIATHSLTIKVPELNDPALILKGAGHYETGCRPCHGSPDFKTPPVFQAMTPHPPYLPPRIPNWDSEDLFYIVKHGVKFTGMPAWPTLKRDDEVWAMVAFLRQFPKLSTAEYKELVYGTAKPEHYAMPMPSYTEPISAEKIALASCARCHGVDGLGRGTGAFPKLAGQSPVYLQNALEAYASGNRYSGVMQPVAERLSPEAIQALALHYTALPAKVSESLSVPAGAAAAIERGREIAHRGIREQHIPSCVDCHGPGATRRKPAYPLIQGQYADYLYLQLMLFKEKNRGGSEYKHIMNRVANGLSEQQMRDVAAYYASLPWPGDSSKTER